MIKKKISTDAKGESVCVYLILLGTQKKKKRENAHMEFGLSLFVTK